MIPPRFHLSPSRRLALFPAAVTKVGKNGPAVLASRVEARLVLQPPNTNTGSARTADAHSRPDGYSLPARPLQHLQPHKFSFCWNKTRLRHGGCSEIPFSSAASPFPGSSGRVPLCSRPSRPRCLARAVSAGSAAAGPLAPAKASAAEPAPPQPPADNQPASGERRGHKPQQTWLGSTARMRHKKAARWAALAEPGCQLTDGRGQNGHFKALQEFNY